MTLGGAMARNLIVLSDGTGNSASKPFKTNVWRLYQALNLRDGSQVALFGDGVGTSSIKVLRVIGLALGFGVKRNVLNLYKFLCRNYQKDANGKGLHDHIYMFGFSRGAFTIRVLAGLIHSQGLVSFTSEADLEYGAVAAYRAYREDVFRTYIPWVKAGRAIRNVVVWCWRSLTGGRQYSEIQKQTIDEGRRHIPIHFIGVWDTVVAYGLPVDELTIAVDKWVWPMKFRDTRLLRNVSHARQALALDDERRTFHPVPWDELKEKEMMRAGEVPGGRLLQVWFPGMHTDVGGGYPDDGLAFVPLCWMMEEVAALGLDFEKSLFDTYKALSAPTGRMYDSRAGAGALWRYQPRNVELLMDKGVRPLVHHCVVTRMRYGNDGYAPFTLPLGIDILLPNKKPIPFEAQEVAKELAAVKAQVAATHPNTPATVRQLESALTDIGEATNAAAGLAHPRHDYFALVLDTVWFRRIVYFVTLGLAVAAIAYPVLYEILRVGDDVAKVDAVTTGFLAFVIALVKGFVPSFATPWLDAISANGLGAVIIGVAFVLSLALSTFLQRRIHDRARAAWGAAHTGPKVDLLKPTGQRHAFLTVAIVLWIVTLFAIQAVGDNKTLFAILCGSAILFTGLYVYRRFRPKQDVNPSSPGFPLAWARSLRTSPGWVKGYRFVAQTLAPALFILAAAYLALSVVNLTAFNVASTVGAFCPDDPRNPSVNQKAREARKLRREDSNISAIEKRKALLREAQREEIDGEREIDIKSQCHATGFYLVAGRQYRIRMVADNWFDKGIPADVGGFSSDGLRHALASPLKRWWFENWFRPVARIGVYGNYEYPLKPAAPLASANFALCKADVQPSKKPDEPSSFQDTSKPASPEKMKEELECEEKEGIRRARVLIADITPGNTGELFLYVNDAVLAVPGLTNVFYKNNTGTAKVTVTRSRAAEIVTKD